MNIIGIFLNNEMRTGANRRYLELMEGLAEKGHNVAVIMNTYLDYAPRHFTRIDIPVKYKRRGFPPASYLFKKAIKKNISFLRQQFLAQETLPADWIHIHGDIHFAAALYLKKNTGAKLFFAFRCNDITRAGILRKQKAYTVKEYIASYVYNAKDWFRERQIAQNADLITFQNTPDRDIFIHRSGSAKRQDKTVIIPGNIGLPRFTNETRQKNISSSVKNLVYVGSVSLSKGLQQLLEAVALLKKRGHTELHLSILGKTSGEEKAFSLVSSLGIVDMVSFEGYVLPFPFLEKCDLMVYPTLYDAFPDTILEALHSGCPVIASRVGGIPEMLEYPDLLFDLANVTQIADKIERCIVDAGFYKKIREYCKTRSALYNFDWTERFAQAMEMQKTDIDHR